MRTYGRLIGMVFLVHYGTVGYHIAGNGQTERSIGGHVERTSNASDSLGQ